ncbi:MAG: RNA polymerase sigma factor [Anaerolineae bacterium]|nr:RNA polymerase sigma factor [Anaerolineae bacterium]
MNQNNTADKSIVDQALIAEWVRQAIDGDQQAFTQIYEHFLPSVHKRVWYVIPTQDVEDVTQEIFIAMMRSLHSFRGDAKFSTWLRVITNRQVANYYRKRSRADHDKNVALEDAESMNAPELSQPANPVDYDDIMLLRNGLRNIPEHYQEILLMRFAEGMRFQDIANDLNKNLDAAKSLFRRAVEALRDEIGEDPHV